MDQTAERQRWKRIATILDAALELPFDERGPYVNRACDGDAALAREVDELLAAAGASATFLGAPAIEHAAPLVVEIERDSTRASANSLHGRIVGPYRLLTELGEGGMGIVYLADRVDGQFDQQVAIKLLRQGMPGEEARRRFLQERQILAHLQHPAIARLLDGGVSADGTPFFVMERVEGRPVTAYCSERALKTEERLRIFLEICEAVQYAHRNLIVHRDLKPSNILVDHAGRVKLLDFGIAKLLGDSESAVAGPAHTVVRALTLDYAAPEQLRGESVSTSTDVYALGVLLYELLTGERPYQTGSAPGQLERAILEQEPAPPSARVKMGDLRRRLSGDLDRIVLKALQKPPERRYPSAEAFATDVRRHLAGLPVIARGDALPYRASKFLGRHRVGVGVAALLMFTLVGGLLATTWQARRAEREARKAEAAKEFLKTLLSAADPTLAKGREPSVRQLLDAGAGRIETELRDQPEVQSEVASLVASVYHSLGEYDQAIALLRADLDRRKRRDGPHSLAAAEVMTQIADALYQQGRYDEAGPMHEEALTIQRERNGERTPQVAELLWDIAGERRNRGDLAGAEEFDKQALAIYVALRGEDSADAAAVRESLAIVYSQLARFSDAAALQQPVTVWRERHLGADHPHTLTARYNLAYYLQALGRFDEAVGITEDVVRRQRRVLGERHDAVAVSLRLLARALDASGRSESALPLMAEALGIHIERFGAENLQVAHDRVWQAVIEMHIGHLLEATRDGREAQRIFALQKGPPRADLPNLRMWIGIVLAEAGQLDQAEAVIARVISDLRSSGTEGPFTALALDALGDVARRRGHPSRARDLAREALPLLERGLGEGHEATAVARVHAGAAEWWDGAPAAGEPLMRAGLAQLEKQFPGGHHDVAAARFVLGDALSHAGRIVEARPLLQGAMAWRQTHLGPADPRTIETRHALDATKP
jgi:tetratricopeptide (TPR) repeat protein/tRNA A-37 threonylcarbamoyl transferase component Bud32